MAKVHLSVRVERSTGNEFWLYTTHHAHGSADRVDEAGVQGAVVHSKGVVLVMLNQVHYRVELQGLHKAILVVLLQDLDQLVAPSFPGTVRPRLRNDHLHKNK